MATGQLHHPCTLSLNPTSFPVFRKAVKVQRQNEDSFLRKILRYFSVLFLWLYGHSPQGLCFTILVLQWKNFRLGILRSCRLCFYF